MKIYRFSKARDFSHFHLHIQFKFTVEYWTRPETFGSYCCNYSES